MMIYLSPVMINVFYQSFHTYKKREIIKLKKTEKSTDRHGSADLCRAYRRKRHQKYPENTGSSG